MNIDRCICTGLTFAQVLARARAGGWDFETLRRETRVGGNCGLCRPYVRCALATGQTLFHQVLVEGSEGA